MKNYKKLVVFFISICFSTSSHAQNRGVAIGKTNSDASAVLDIASSNVMTTGSGATATATVNALGQVTAVTVNNGGSGYSGNLMVNIFGTGDTYLMASGARATANITNGVITSITVTNGGSGYVAGKTSVSINPGNKAVVFPRVNLITETNGTAPVATPRDGLHVFNNPININSGIYFWNSNIPKWDRAIPYVEIPKGALIKYSGTDQNILDNEGAGASVNLSDGTEGFYVYNPIANQMGFRSLALDGSGYLYNNIEPGRYKLELTFYFNAPAPNPSSQGTQINGNSGYYYMGYFIDCILYEYDSVTMSITPQQPVLPLPFTQAYPVLNRKEYGVISKPNQFHRMTQIYNLNIPTPTAGKKYCIKFGLGRMQNSGLNDQFSFSRSRSYIKINKY